MDWAAGEILDTIVDLGIANNTLVFFTSDHGPHIEVGVSPPSLDGLHHVSIRA